MNRKHLIDTRSCFVGLASSASFAGSISAGEQVSNRTMTLSLRDEFRTAAGRENPNPDRVEQPVWHFLRTTRSEGPIATRRWLHDGRSARLVEKGDRVFGLPFDGWIFRLSPAESPVVSAALEDRAGGLIVGRSDIVVAPGPEHAVIVGWESPVSGTLAIQGSCEHSRASSGVAWHVERGSPPDTDRGFELIQLASGQLKFGTEKQCGDFAVNGLKVAVGDVVYFVVDALADGTSSPFTGDGTRLDVPLTVQNAASPPPPTFAKDIRPLLAAKCHDCHGGDSQAAKLDLRTRSEILRGGENGPAVVRGEPQNSLLIDLVSQGQMPPGKDDKLSPKQLAFLRRWLQGGTPADEKVVPWPPHARITEMDRDYGAFQPPHKVAEPQVRSTDRVRTPMDRFLLSKLKEQRLTFSPDADRGVLIRRAYLDLTGRPSEPAAVKAFLDDARPNADELLSDDLLKSPHDGERWGRHWLDVAGYVDAKLDIDLGTIDPNNGIWRDRDYVMQAFNDDMPFNQFLTEQLAGDELVDWRQAETFDTKTKLLLAATGFLRNVDDHTDFPQHGIEKRYEVVNETLDMFSTAVLGLTMECCRCHNHKYDPLPQRDYDRLMACLEPAFNPHAWKMPKDRYLADVSPQERAAIDQRNVEIDKQVAEFSQREAMTRGQVRQRVYEMRLATLPEAIRADVKQAFELAPDKRNVAQKVLAATHEAALKVTDADEDAALTEAEKAALTQSADRRAALSAQKKFYGVIQALWDVGTPPVSHVHRRGNVKAHGVLVQPGFPEILQPIAMSASAAASDVQGETRGRRLALARWLTEPDHPLTARVLVNRVWHHHFGRGIVETLGNFGHSGSMPSHRELLDWLAVDFIEHGWSVTHLHRQILLSTVSRQTSRRQVLPRQARDSDAATMSAEKIDPDNRLLWRMHLRRLEAEIVRDTVLAMSGSLDRTAGGPPVEITNPADGLSEAKLAPASTSPNRQSVYLFARRVYPLKFLELFDAPIMPVNCTQRMNSATVLQSLAVLNSEFLFAQSDQLASCIVNAAGPGAADQVQRAFQLTFVRPPTETERAKSLTFLGEQERGYVSAGNPAILNPLGIDHTKLTFTHSGRPERLTDPDVTGARVVEELLT